MGARRDLSDRRIRHDAAYLRAKREQFAGRAVYKLREIDIRFRLLRRGARVLDLGCWPGSWMQYIAEKIGPDGRLVGVDIDALEIALPPHATSVVGDAHTLTTAEVLLDLPAYDLVLSDMAPNTTGDSETDVWRQEELWLSAHALATKVLRVGGHFAAKAFQGERFPLLLETLKAHFQEARAYRCKETRSGSREQYLIGRGLRATRPLLP